MRYYWYLLYVYTFLCRDLLRFRLCRGQGETGNGGVGLSQLVAGDGARHIAVKAFEGIQNCLTFRRHGGLGHQVWANLISKLIPKLRLQKNKTNPSLDASECYRYQCKGCCTCYQPWSAAYSKQVNMGTTLQSQRCK